MTRETDRARFGRVRSLYGRALSRVVATYARPGPDQDDLAQEVALALWQALPKFRGECTEQTFILRIAHNRGVSHMCTRRHAPLDGLDPVDPAIRPDAELVDRERSALLFEALRSLHLPYRQVLSLALEGLTHAEIAATLGLQVDAVSQRISRARVALRARLGAMPT